MTTTQSLLDGENKSRYFDRELSWLSFNERVLWQAKSEANPIGEKLRFISISASNLDEFLMVRLAGMYQLQMRGYHRMPETDAQISGLLEAIEAKVTYLLSEQQKAEKQVLSQLAENHCDICDVSDLTAEQLNWLEEWYEKNLLPLLSPTTIDPRHPFPFIQNKGQGLLIEMANHQKKAQKVVILLPLNTPRFIAVPAENNMAQDALKFVPAETAIMAFLDKIYPDFNVKQSGMFRLLRDSDVEIDDEAADLVSQFETALRKRRRGNVVSLIISDGLSKSSRNFLKTQFNLSETQIFVSSGLVGAGDLSEIVSRLPSALLYPEYTPRFPQRIVDFKGDCFASIRNKDIIVHHPYESFDVVVRFLEQAARDPDVLAIRQTLYRTSPQSPIAKALVEAAENGKTVMALIELKARFDEENNIQLARMLERAGAQVAYGIADLKVHSKLTHITRRESGKLASYVHCGTGNYHPITAKIYTDLSFFTCDEKLCSEIWQVFNFLTSYVPPKKLSKAVMSPTHAIDWLYSAIDTEIKNAEQGLPAHIWIKTNAIVDKGVIDRLYEASNAGVKIDLCVRGICCLRPQVTGLSENIRVWSIIGRFLEHGRIYAFANGEALGKSNTKVFIGSADLMPRNLYRRVEVLVPLENRTVRKQVLSQVVRALDLDKRNSWDLQPDGAYTKLEASEDNLLSAHEYFMQNPSLSGQGSLAPKTSDNK